MASHHFKTYKDESSGKEYFEWIEIPTTLRTAEGGKLFVTRFPRWKIVQCKDADDGSKTYVLNHAETCKGGDNVFCGKNVYTVTIRVSADGSTITPTSILSNKRAPPFSTARQTVSRAPPLRPAQ